MESSVLPHPGKRHACHKEERDHRIDLHEKSYELLVLAEAQKFRKPHKNFRP